MGITLFFCFILGAMFLLWIFRNKIENNLKSLVASSIETPSAIQIHPGASLKKQWSVGDEVLGTLDITASGLNLKESIAGVEALLDLSLDHDKVIQKDKKTKKKDVCIG